LEGQIKRFHIGRSNVSSSGENSATHSTERVPLFGPVPSVPPSDLVAPSEHALAGQKDVFTSGALKPDVNRKKSSLAYLLLDDGYPDAASSWWEERSALDTLRIDGWDMPFNHLPVQHLNTGLSLEQTNEEQGKLWSHCTLGEDEDVPPELSRKL